MDKNDDIGNKWRTEAQAYLDKYFEKTLGAQALQKKFEKKGVFPKAV